MSNLETVCLLCHVVEHEVYNSNKKRYENHLLNSPFNKREFKKSALRRNRKDLLKKYNLLYS